MKNERLLYEPARIALEKYFKKFGECCLEITSEGDISEPMKDLLESYTPLTLYLINIESFRPDLMGYFAREYYKSYGPKEIIVVEVKKDKPQIKNIFSQAKAYGEVFGAKHSFLVSPEPIPAEKRKIIEDRPSILSYSGNREQVRICQLNVEKKEILKNSWFPSSPIE
jgi:hypothetical protein